METLVTIFNSGAASSTWALIQVSWQHPLDVKACSQKFEDVELCIILHLYTECRSYLPKHSLALITPTETI